MAPLSALLALLSVGLLATGADAYAHGYDNCDRPFPSHGVNNYGLAGPFKLMVNASDGSRVVAWAPGQTYTVTLHGGALRGYNAVPLLGTIASVTPLGMGAPKAGALLPLPADTVSRSMRFCPGGITQQAATNKVTVSWLWVPPSAGAGSVTLWTGVQYNFGGQNWEVKLELPEVSPSPGSVPSVAVTPSPSPSSPGGCASAFPMGAASPAAAPSNTVAFSSPTYDRDGWGGKLTIAAKIRLSWRIGSQSSTGGSPGPGEISFFAWLPTSTSAVWMGFAVADANVMLGNVAIVGTPVDNQTSQMVLTTKIATGMETAPNTATNSGFAWTRTSATTFNSSMWWTRKLSAAGVCEDKSIDPDGVLSLIYAFGTAAAFGNHGTSNRGFIKFRPLFNVSYASPTPSTTPSMTASATSTASGTASATASSVPSFLPGATQTASGSATASALAPSVSATATATQSFLPTATATASTSASNTPTPSVTPSPSSDVAGGGGGAGSDPNAGQTLIEDIIVAWQVKPDTRSVHFSMRAPGRVWLCVARATSDSMIWPAAGLALVGFPGAAGTGAAGGTFRLDRMDGYTLPEFQAVTLEASALAPTATGAGRMLAGGAARPMPAVAAVPAGGRTLASTATGSGITDAIVVYDGVQTVFNFTRRYEGLGDQSTAVAAGDLAVDPAAVQGWIYARGYPDGGYGPDGNPHEFWGYKLLRLQAQQGGGGGGCDPTQCSYHGSCSRDSSRLCDCDAGYGGDVCDKCVSMYARKAGSGTNFTCELQHSAIRASVQLQAEADGSVFGDAGSVLRANRTAAVAAALAQAGNVTVSRLNVTIGTAGTGGRRLVQETAATSGSRRAAAATSTVTITVGVRPTLDSDEVPSTTAADSIKAAAADGTSPLAQALQRLGLALNTTDARVAHVSYTPEAAPALCLSAPGSSTSSSRCGFPFKLPLGKNMAMAWRVDAEAWLLHVQLAFTVPTVADRKWYGIAFGDGPGMVGGDGVAVEPGKPAGQQVNRYALQGYTSKTCPGYNDVTMLPAYAGMQETVGAIALDAPGVEPAVSALATAPGPGALTTVATFTRHLRLPQQATSATTGIRDIDPTSELYITWAWGPAHALVMGTHTKAMSGALRVNLATGKAVPAWATSWYIVLLHAGLMVAGMLVLLPAAAFMALCGRRLAAATAAVDSGGGTCKQGWQEEGGEAGASAAAAAERSVDGPYAYWRRAHAQFSQAAFLCVAAGAALGVSMTAPFAAWASLHGKLGLAIIVLLSIAAAISVVTELGQWWAEEKEAAAAATGGVVGGSLRSSKCFCAGCVGRRRPKRPVTGAGHDSASAAASRFNTGKGSSAGLHGALSGLSLLLGPFAVVTGLAQAHASLLGMAAVVVVVLAMAAQGTVNMCRIQRAGAAVSAATAATYASAGVTGSGAFDSVVQSPLPGSESPDKPLRFRTGGMQVSATGSSVPALSGTTGASTSSSFTTSSVEFISPLHGLALTLGQQQQQEEEQVQPVVHAGGRSHGYGAGHGSGTTARGQARVASLFAAAPLPVAATHPA